LPTVAQISDLHLSPRVPARQAQVEPILQAINAAKPDLVVISGDVTDDGWERPDDLVWAKQWLEERIDGDWFAVPGNHDVGNFAGAKEGAITVERVTEWNKHFGAIPERCFPAVNAYQGTSNDGWAVMGINSMLLGSGKPAESDQRQQLFDDLRCHSIAGFDIALFLHSPLFLREPLVEVSTAADYWLGPTNQRYSFWDELDQEGAALIASGHVHQTRIDRLETAHSLAVNIAWAPPASGTWVHAPGLPNPPAPEKTGFVMHHLGDDGSVRSEVIECAPMLKTVAFDPLANG